VETAVVVERSRLLQHELGFLAGRDRDIELAGLCRGRVVDDVVVDPLDGVADAGLDLQ
jgi:hypothetical protein